MTPLKPNESTDPQTFLALFTPNNRAIFHFILSMIPNWNDAQDVMQETSRVLWERFHTFEPGTDFVAWAVTIAKFQAMSFRKQKSRQKNVFLPDDLLELVASDYTYDRVEDRAFALRHCLAKLNASDRRHLNLRFQQEYTPKYLARSLGVSVKRVYRNETRIMGLLLRCIRRRLFEQGVLG
ncbi:MAG: sigma-70 family RNA polymerase sigma factor [Phycisphaerae bacterium]|nr:sigma-70 family RNA polymerase sigma factor [Phycisphaerae bacterium]